jgi:hypothetical protein
MARRGGPPGRRGPTMFQIITWVIAFLVVLSMIVSILPIAQQ